MGFSPPLDAVPTPGNPLPPLPGTVASFVASLPPLGALNDLSEAVLEAKAEIANALALVNQKATDALRLARILLNPSFLLSAAASFTTPSFELCGFGIPKFTFAFAINLNFTFLFNFPPNLLFTLQLPCGFALQISLGSGGGRTGNPPPQFGIEFG